MSCNSAAVSPLGARSNAEASRAGENSDTAVEHQAHREVHQRYPHASLTIPSDTAPRTEAGATSTWRGRPAVEQKFEPSCLLPKSRLWPLLHRTSAFAQSPSTDLRYITLRLSTGRLLEALEGLQEAGRRLRRGEQDGALEGDGGTGTGAGSRRRLLCTRRRQGEIMQDCSKSSGRGTRANSFFHFCLPAASAPYHHQHHLYRLIRHLSLHLTLRRSSKPSATPQMKHVAAYLLLVSGGNASPSAADVTELLATVECVTIPSLPCFSVVLTLRSAFAASPPMPSASRS